MTIDVYLQENYQDKQLVLDEEMLCHIADVTLNHLNHHHNSELSIVCVDKHDSQTFNAQYRHKDKPTNVLSFPSDIDEATSEFLDTLPLGDLIICIPIVITEANEQHKTPIQHFTHLVVHGILHLLGYDHEISDKDAEEMESLEIDILSKLGINNPYLPN